MILIATSFEPLNLQFSYTVLTDNLSQLTTSLSSGGLLGIRLGKPIIGVKLNSAEWVTAPLSLTIRLLGRVICHQRGKALIKIPGSTDSHYKHSTTDLVLYFQSRVTVLSRIPAS